MTEAEILAYWERANERLRNTPDVRDKIAAFITGDTPTLTGLGQKSYYLDYPREIIKEAEGGENAEMARRLLYVLTTRRNDPISYQAKEDAHVCFLAGWSADMLAINIVTKKNYYHGTEILRCMEADYSIDELAQAVKKLAAAGSKFEQRGAATLLRGLVLSLPEHERFAEFVEPFCAQVDSLESFSSLRAYLLTRAGRNLPLVRKLMLRKFEKSINLLCSYYGSCMNGKLGEQSKNKMVEEDGLPVYMYHVLQWIPVVNYYNQPILPVTRYYQQVWKEDPESIRQAYEYFWSCNVKEYRLGALLMVAVMLLGGESAENIPHFEETVCTMPNIIGFTSLAQLDANKWNYARYLRGELPLEDGCNLIRGLNSARGDGQKLISIYRLLYGLHPAAKRFFDTIFPLISKDASSSPWLAVYEAGILGRGEWMGTSLYDRTEKFIEMGFPRKTAIICYCVNSYYTYTFDASLTAALIRGHEQEALDILNEMCTMGEEASTIVNLVNLLYIEVGLTDYAPLTNLCKHKSKVVRNCCEKLLAAHEQEARPLLEQMKPKLKGEAAKMVARLLKLWDNERKFGKDFAFNSNEQVIEFCQDNLSPDADKLLSWIPADLFDGVRFADLSGTAPACVLRFILSEYLSLNELYRVLPADKVAAKLNPADLQATLENIYSLWLDQGADTKRKLVMLPYCVFASDPQIIKLRRQLESWAENSRGALAASIVPMIALNGNSVALMMVEGMGNKFPNNQVKKAAKSAFSFAANALEISEDELADRIIPNLGFNREGELSLDYGPRSFTVSLQPDFSLTIFDPAKNKQVKSLPKPAASDDPVKAEAAKKAFSELKKQMKAVVQNQTARLEKVFMNGRCWSAGRWSGLFVENPILHRFATGLVWGVYEGGKLVQSFRYMEDGTFNTVDEEEYTLPENAQISLAHPIELGEEQTAAWQQQLEDYEIVQPLTQLSLTIRKLDKSEVENGRITLYQNRSISYGRMQSLAKKYDMIRGDVLDGGGFWCYHMVDRYLGIQVHIAFDEDGMYMGMGYDETTPMGDVTFLRLPQGKAPEDDIQDNMILDPLGTQVPERFICCVLALVDSLCE